MKRRLLISILFFVPTFAFAQSSSADDVLDYILSIVKALSGMVGSLAIAFFFWNLIKFLKSNAEGKADLKKSKDMMIWSGVALFMMVGIWSIVAYVQSSLGADLHSNITETPALPENIDM